MPKNEKLGIKEKEPKQWLINSFDNSVDANIYKIQVNYIYTDSFCESNTHLTTTSERLGDFIKSLWRLATTSSSLLAQVPPL
jgi:hypothetical protein